MNVEEIKSIIRSRFPTTEQLGEYVFKAYSLYEKMPFALWIFDCSETIAREGFDFDTYQDELLREEFYRVAGSLQWNLYCYFLCEEEIFAGLRSRRIVEIIEGDRIYARKFVRTPAMLLNDFTSLENIATEAITDIPADIGALWRNKLADHGLSVVVSDLPYTETIKRIKSGEEANNTGIEYGKRTEQPESLIECIEAIDLGTFRQRPSRQQFEFVNCNLIYGANGSGKTSLFEGIEAWMCGKHRRNPEEKIKLGSLKLKISGIPDWQPGPVSNKALYRDRDHSWYGNFQARENKLCYNFARFSFYDSDAAVRLESSKNDGEIETALSRLLLGEEATRISERIDKILQGIKQEEQHFKKEISNAKLTIRDAKKTIESLEKPTESSKQTYENLCRQLPQLGWKGESPTDSVESCLQLLNSINDITATIESIVSEIKWIQPVSPMTLGKEKESIEACCGALEKLAGQLRSLEQENQELTARLLDYDRKTKLLNRRLEFTKAGADVLFEMANQQQKAQQRKASLMAANKELVGIDLSRYSDIDEPIANMATRIQGDVDKKEQLTAQAKAAAISLESVHGRIAGLLSEVRTKAQELLEADKEAEVCPVCGAQYKKGELLELVRHVVSPLIVPELQKAHTQLAQLEEETVRLNSTLRDLEVLQSVGRDVMEITQPGDLPVKTIVAALTLLERGISQCDRDLTRIQRDREQLQAKGFTEQELMSLNDNVASEFPDLTTATKDALERLRSELEQKQITDEARFKECSEQVDNLQKRKRELLTQHFGREDVTSEEAKKHLNQISMAFNRLKELQEFVDLAEAHPLSDVLLRLNSFHKTTEGFIRLRQQEETMARVKDESESRIKEAQATINQQKPIHDRLEKAIEVLNGIQKEDGVENYIQQFFTNNLQQISDLFSVMHAPRDFEKIIWDQDLMAIRAIRKSDSAECSVSNFSSGQRNALSLAIFLTMNQKVKYGPSLIMLDDPVAHVDDLNIVSFFDCLRELLLGYERQIFFATASAKTANLFAKKFDYLGKDKFREFELLI